MNKAIISIYQLAASKIAIPTYSTPYSKTREIGKVLKVVSDEKTKVAIVPLVRIDDPTRGY
jgi:hypothetical protein